MSRRSLTEATYMLTGKPGDFPTRTDYTKQNRAMLQAGRHPANGLRVCPDLGKCGDCAFHVVWKGSKRWHKCKRHRLGLSSSEASDIRVSWPACELFKPAESA